MTKIQSLWNHGFKTGLIGGASALVVTMVGMVEAFNKRDIIADVVSIGIALLLSIGVFASYIAAKKTLGFDKKFKFFNAFISGFITYSFLALLVITGSFINLRQMFVAASPVLYKILTFGYMGISGVFILLITGLICGACGGILIFLNNLTRKTIVNSFLTIFALGLLQELILPILRSWNWSITNYLGSFFYSQNGLTLKGTMVFLILFCGLYLSYKLKSSIIKSAYADLKPDIQKRTQVFGFVLLFIVLIVLPHFLGLFLSEVLTIVGLYVLLGLGLNIVVGYAGLLDLGYVAFFAIGSYATAILTSPAIGFFALNFWQALPVSVVLGVLAGVLLGIPVLKMRGDYLAIATLGFGEIIRILVLSDFLRPWLGGAQGIGAIPNPNFMGFQMVKPQHIYYLILAGCILVVFISLRLKNSKLGRAWMAMREDEDVAQAMGINLVATKLLAFATGAGFSALSGAIFVSKIGSVYPHSFNVFISINVVCLIIIGGIGSLPGVIVGAAVLIGLPELLREFAEYRMFVYGAALVTMMLLRPEGLWPEARHKIELHSDDEALETSIA